MAGRWILGAGGVITPAKNWSHNTQAEPTVHGITPGHAPAGFVHGNAAEGGSRGRRYDKATEEQVKQFMKEDEMWSAKQTAIEPVVEESSRDIKSGKIKFDNEIFRQDGGVSPFAAVENDDGSMHIVRKEKAPPPKRTLPPPGDPVAAAHVAKLVTAPSEGRPLENSITLKQQIRRGFGAIMQSDGASHIGRTF